MGVRRNAPESVPNPGTATSRQDLPERLDTSAARASDIASVLWHDGQSRWWKETKAEISGMRRAQMVEELVLAGVVTEESMEVVSTSWIRQRLAYYRQEGRRDDLGLSTPAAVQERIAQLDATGRLPRWYVDIFIGGYVSTERGSGMAKKGKDEGTVEKKEKVAKAPRNTISSLMVQILRRKVVPTNAEIEAEVKEAFPESKFNGAHCSWYKGAFMAGKLPGQNGEGETINQPQVREKKEKDEAPAPKAKGKPAPAPAPEAKKKLAPKKQVSA